MTRFYAAKRLLQLGPLTFAELIDITGWSARSVPAPEADKVASINAIHALLKT